jgi:hypothetical protein
MRTGWRARIASLAASQPDRDDARVVAQAMSLVVSGSHSAGQVVAFRGWS